ncbi:family 43 glycosylhydrolase, partial [Sphingobacterium sp. IITKGP-BTPF85]
MMKIFFYFLAGFVLYISQPVYAQQNPVFPGWYADPEGIIYNNEYWVFPTYSARYEDQIFFDAFSSKDFVTWKKHHRIIDTAEVKWAKKAMWAPSVFQKDKKYYLF